MSTNQKFPGNETEGNSSHASTLNEKSTCYVDFVFYLEAAYSNQNGSPNSSDCLVSVQTCIWHP